VSGFDAQIDVVRTAMPFRIVGQVQGISGLTIEAAELPLPVGSLCRISSFGAQSSIAEVIGFKHGRTLLMPLSQLAGVSAGDKVENIASAPRVGCSRELLGRIINGYGQPIDGKGPLHMCQSRRIDGRGLPPLKRVNIDQPIATSIRSVDGLHTCGRGQRMGIFSGPGVGKSTLVAMIAKNTSADVSVIALIGERGRELQEFVSKTMGEEGMQRCVVVVSTSDDPPLLRVRAAKVAATVAEFFRDEGNDVLLLMDSLTRLAHAQRQIGLAAQEPPATKGYPPSVFAMLPELLERAGRCEQGSVTGFYTVLVEGDDFNEPIADAVKGITDGHLWLSRALANRGHYPAVDPLQSISRVRNDVIPAEQLRAAKKILALLATYQEIEDLVNIGAYTPGLNADFDAAVQSRPKILQYLQQDSNSPASLDQSRKQLIELGAWIEQMEKVVRAQSSKTAKKEVNAAV
jgi:flagellum-specific ATP synthase